MARTLSELRALAEELLEKVENAETVDEKDRAEEELEKVVNEYTATSKSECYARCKDSGDPMKTAILEFAFPSIRVKETKDKDSGIVTRSIDDVLKSIDLGDLHRKLNGIGEDTKWINMAEKLNFHLTMRAAKRVNAKVKSDAYYLNDLSKQIDMGKNPLSNTQILNTLQMVITAMLGEEYKATSHDVNYLVDVYSNDNKKSKTGITAANHKTLRNYLKKVCYRILTNGTGYDIESKEIKE